jgi:tRNA threonylcarbamoyladenosine biosynthesis protein TsaB
MKILAVDTATSSLSVAVTDAGGLRTELTRSTGETHARHLMALVDTVLTLSDVTVDDLDAFAVTIGPGTFTGLRIGISTVQGMAMAASKPVAGISSLEALAVQASPLCQGVDSLVCAMLDARRQEVYGGLFRSNGHGLESVSDPRVGPPDTFLDAIEEPCLLVGSGALMVQDVFRDKLPDRFSLAATGAHIIRGETIARLAFSAFADSAVPVSRVLQPLYLRHSDAEINLAKKRSRAEFTVKFTEN